MTTVGIFGILAMVALTLAATLSFLSDLKRVRSAPTASQRRDQNERIREAYMSKEQRAREMRERIRRERVRRERARERAGYRPTSGPGGHASGGPSGSASGTASDWTAMPTPPDEDRHRATLELVGDVTPDRLRRNYRRLVAAYHPDRVAGLGEKLQRLAEEETKSINEAYSFFKRRLGM